MDRKEVGYGDYLFERREAGDKRSACIIADEFYTLSQGKDKLERDVDARGTEARQESVCTV